MTQQTYVIPVDNLDSLLEQINKLNKRATKLGVPGISTNHELDHRMYEFVKGGNKRWVEEDKRVQGGDWRATGKIRDYFKFTVVGETPRFAGWSLMATLEPLVADGVSENVVRSVPGYDVPTSYRSRTGECDHCKARRNRKETFVVVHDDGSTKMIGRQCIKDFLGHADPHKLASFAELLFDLNAMCCGAEDEFRGGGSGGIDSYDLQHVLKVTSAVIRESGWMSKGKAQEGDIPTARMVGTYLHPTPPAYRSKDETKWLAKIDARLEEEEHEEQATATIEWCKSLDREGFAPCCR